VPSLDCWVDLRLAIRPHGLGTGRLGRCQGPVRVKRPPFLAPASPFRSSFNSGRNIAPQRTDKVDVIVTNATPPVIAAKQATSVIPIVFAAAGDPVGTGLVASLARPGGHVTGLSLQSADVASKRLGLLREVIPGLSRLAILANAGNPNAALEIGELQAAARGLGVEVATPEIRRAEDIAPAIEALKDRAEALFVHPLVTTNWVRINTLALGARLPTMHGIRESVEAGGLMSYAAHVPDLFRRAGDYVDKILRGAKPADLPVEQPTKFELVINLTTAKALGLDLSPTLLARADEVIE
jgi:putative ABC transport system substrate-binding protein